LGDSRHDFQDETRGRGTTVCILEIDPQHMIAHRQHGGGHVDACGLDERLYARRQIHGGIFYVSDFQGLRVDPRPKDSNFRWNRIGERAAPVSERYSMRGPRVIPRVVSEAGFGGGSFASSSVIKPSLA
jgi:hypothetical protein